MTSPEGSRLGVLIRQLQGRVASLEEEMASRTVQVHEVRGTASIGPLGGAWQAVPGLTKTLTLETGDIVLLDASVYLQGSFAEAFFLVDGVTTMLQNASAIGSLPSGNYNPGPVATFYVSPNDGSHVFAVYATDAYAGGTGYVAGGFSHMRVTVISGI